MGGREGKPSNFLGMALQRLIIQTNDVQISAGVTGIGQIWYS